MELVLWRLELPSCRGYSVLCGKTIMTVVAGYEQSKLYWTEKVDARYDSEGSKTGSSERESLVSEGGKN